MPTNYHSLPWQLKHETPDVPPFKSWPWHETQFAAGLFSPVLCRTPSLLTVWSAGALLSDVVGELHAENKINTDKSDAVNSRIISPFFRKVVISRFQECIRHSFLTVPHAANSCTGKFAIKKVNISRRLIVLIILFMRVIT